MKQKNKKLGLYFSGGGARSMCYYGVLQVLLEEGITPHLIGAHSGAAILLAYMARSKDPKKVIRAFSRHRFYHTPSFNPYFNRGVVSVKRVMKRLDRVSKKMLIEELEIPAFIVASDFTDMNAPQKVIYDHGNLAYAATISSIVPPIMPFYQDVEGRILGDGGFISLYSAKEMRARGCDVVIGLFPDAVQYTRVPRVAHDYSRLLKSLMSARGKYEIEKEPVDLEIKDYDCSVGLNDFKYAEEAYDAGYRKAKGMLKEITNLLV